MSLPTLNAAANSVAYLVAALFVLRVVWFQQQHGRSRRVLLLLIYTLVVVAYPVLPYAVLATRETAANFTAVWLRPWVLLAAPGFAFLALVTQRYGQQRQREAETTELQNQFIANVSHELRTPLNVIMGYAAPELADVAHMPVIYRAAERMAFLINNVLGVARLEEGGPLEKTAVDLAAVVEESVTGMHILAQRSGIGLFTKLNSTMVYASEPALVLMVNNLLHNAIKFNRPGGSVEISTFTAAGGGALQVRDSGIGIAAADFPRLFQRFVQLDGSDRRSFSGVGIGLYFVDLLVQAHDGRIEVHSVPGEGSLFEVWLPGVEA